MTTSCPGQRRMLYCGEVYNLVEALLFLNNTIHYFYCTIMTPVLCQTLTQQKTASLSHYSPHRTAQSHFRHFFLTINFTTHSTPNSRGYHCRFWDWRCALLTIRTEVRFKKINLNLILKTNFRFSCNATQPYEVPRILKTDFN